MKNVTISDVAVAAGVAKSTVSAVINGKSGVKDGTRRWVLQIIDELKYRPSTAARNGFRTVEEKAVTFIVKEAANPYYAEVLAGIRGAMAERGYLISTISSEGKCDAEQAIVRQAMRQGVAGLIIAPVLNDDTDLSYLFELKRNNVPFVLLENIRGVRADLVDIDNVRASLDATRYLLGLGHSRIAHFAGPAYSEHSQERAEGVRRGFSESHLAFDESLMVPAGDAFQDGYLAGLEYFREASEAPPTAVLCYNDLVAIGLLRALRELGIRVPEDVSVIGFDDIQMLEYLPVPLTTVHVPKLEMGRRAAEMLIRRIESGHDEAVEKVVLEATLVVRQSTAAPAGSTVDADPAAERTGVAARRAR
jgi:LacI family transcriptional regulator